MQANNYLSKKESSDGSKIITDISIINIEQL